MPNTGMEMAKVAAAHAVEVSHVGSSIVPSAAVRASGDPGVHRSCPGDTQKIVHISDHYEIGKELGSGYTATVYEARCRATGRMVAVKDIDKSRQRLIASDDYYRLIYAALARLPPHRHLLLPPVALLESSTHFYIVMELCHGLDLVEYVLNHPPGGISTSSCRRLMQQLLLGVHFLHSHNILHRDIKLDNIIFRQSEPQPTTDAGQTGDLALLDFDMCFLLNHKERPRPKMGSNDISIVGTREYMAPECFRGQYSTASDIWSLGVILYVLLDGHFPFDVNCCNGSSKNSNPSASPNNGKRAADTQQQQEQQQQQQQQQSGFSGRAIRRLLRQGVQFFSGVRARHPVATDLIEKMLTFDVRARMQNAFDALHHPWLLPVPSPVPRQREQIQQTHQLQHQGPLLSLQQAPPGYSDSVAATTATGVWTQHDHPAPAAAVAGHQQQQQEQHLLLLQQEASRWGTLSSRGPLSLARAAPPQLRGPSDTPAAPKAHEYLRQQIVRQQNHQHRSAQQQEQRQAAASPRPAAAPALAGYSLDDGTKLRRGQLTAAAAAAAAVACSPKDIRRRQNFPQQQHQFLERQQCNVVSAQEHQMQQLSFRDFVVPSRSSVLAPGGAPLGAPAGPQQRLEVQQQRQKQCMRRQLKEHHNWTQHLPHVQPQKYRDEATLAPQPASAVSTRLPSSLPPSSQPSDFLGQAGGIGHLSPSRSPCGFRGPAVPATGPSAVHATLAPACSHASVTPYSSATTTASCSKPSTPTLEYLPARRDDAAATAAVVQQQQQQQRTAGGQRTVSRSMPLSGVSLVLQLQQRLQQQQQQQQLAQMQNRHFQLQQQLQHQLLRQSMPRRNSAMGALPPAAAEPPRLGADFAATNGFDPRNSIR